MTAPRTVCGAQCPHYLKMDPGDCCRDIDPVTKGIRPETPDERFRRLFGGDKGAIPASDVIKLARAM